MLQLEMQLHAIKVKQTQYVQGSSPAILNSFLPGKLSMKDQNSSLLQPQQRPAPSTKFSMPVVPQNEI